MATQKLLQKNTLRNFPLIEKFCCTYTGMDSFASSYDCKNKLNVLSGLPEKKIKLPNLEYIFLEGGGGGVVCDALPL